MSAACLPRCGCWINSLLNYEVLHRARFTCYRGIARAENFMHPFAGAGLHERDCGAQTHLAADAHADETGARKPSQPRGGRDQSYRKLP